LRYIDCFNGDADGICALLQLRLDDPQPSTLVTGVKRDIALLDRVQTHPGDIVTALDISLDKNRSGLMSALNRGVRVRWFDHHYPGEVPSHPLFDGHIETLPDKGTSLLVDESIGGRYRAWAVVGTYGDNFDQSAARAAAPLGLDAGTLATLRELGILINYNGYGSALDDLHIAPDALFRKLIAFPDPLDFVASDATFQQLREGYRADMAAAEDLAPELQSDRHAVLILPSEAWARRVGGVYANALAQAAPARAHALLTRLSEGGFIVSVRAPIERPDGADDLCRQFETGGGRKAAAGINRLPESDYDRFVEAFLNAF
jgi:hypothetical protein